MLSICQTLQRAIALSRIFSIYHYTCMQRRYHIVALPGEGIGPEVVEAGLTILQQVAQLHGFSVAIASGLIGIPAFEQFGSYFPNATDQLCQGSDGIILGAVSQGGLLELRQRFDFFINLRPVQPSPHLFNKSALAADRIHGVDILFVRELVSGIYFGPAGRGQENGRAYGYHTMRYFDDEIRRIAVAALNQSQVRRRSLTVAHKANALPHLRWVQLVQAEAKAFPQVQVIPMLVDNLAMQLVFNPQQFDVILSGNLFGDILSDIGGALVGSLGLLGSASLNAEGFGLYEPIHGTAPDIAGQGIANPVGMLTSLMLMLQQWGEEAAAAHLQETQEKVFAQGYRTADLSPQPHETVVNTRQFVNVFLRNLCASPKCI